MIAFVLRRVAQTFAVLGVVAASVENLATEIRHLQRTEVGEAEEPFAVGQKGSSAMPHKRNPVLSENLTGLARMIRAAIVPALENVALWHERDISHSSVERVMLPDACILADFALFRLARLVDAVRQTLSDALDRGGSTLRDYVDSAGEPGSFQLEYAVYGREGLPCPACGTPVRSVRQGQRSTFYCPACQR